MNWKWLALGSAFFAGLTAILAKIGVEDIPSNLATLYRTMVILIFLVLLVSVRGDWRPPAGLSGHSLLFLTLSGLASGLSWICYYRALQMAPASLVAPLDKLSLVFAVLLAIVFLGERLTVTQWAGAALMTLGAFHLAVR